MNERKADKKKLVRVRKESESHQKKRKISQTVFKFGRNQTKSISHDEVYHSLSHRTPREFRNNHKQIHGINGKQFTRILSKIWKSLANDNSNLHISRSYAVIWFHFTSSAGKF